MTLILPGNVATATASTGYTVCNSADNAVLTFTPDSTTNRRTGTFSFWVKTTLENNAGEFFAYGENYSKLKFVDNPGLQTSFSEGEHQSFAYGEWKSDCAAWKHYMILMDTTQGTDANKSKFWLNGVQVTRGASGAYPSTNFDTDFNLSGTNMYVGAGRGGGAIRGPMGAYLAEVAWLDGQAITDPTTFGEYNSDSPSIWQPKDFKDDVTFGDNGFYLEFKETGTSQNSSGIGADTSGNNNHFAVTNFVAADIATDTPTNNFAVLNPLDNFYAGSAFAQGNCQATQVAGGVYGVNTSTIGLTKGKWYFEAVYTTTNDSLIGITDKPQLSAGAELGDTATQWSIYGNGSSTLLRNNNAQITWGASVAQGDVVGVAIDMDNLRLYFANENTWMNSGDPTDGTGKIDITTSTGVVFPAVGAYGNTPVWQLNFGGCPVFAISSAASDADGYGNFEFTPPNGYYAICTKNLAEYG